MCKYGFALRPYFFVPLYREQRRQDIPAEYRGRLVYSNVEVLKHIKKRTKSERTRIRKDEPEKMRAVIAERLTKTARSKDIKEMKRLHVRGEFLL